MTSSDYQTLVANLKSKNAPVYNWLLKRGIDLHNIASNAQAFITAASFLLSLPQGSLLPPVNVEIPAIVTAFDTSKNPSIPKETLRAQSVRDSYGTIIRESAAKYDVDPNLIFATIMIESGGNPRAIRYEPRINDASYGLGQLLYGTAKGLGYTGRPEGLFDPAINIDLIARYHRRNLDHYGHLTAEQLTTAYNTGSPYKQPLAGHLAKFNKWYNRVDNLEIDLS